MPYAERSQAADEAMHQGIDRLFWQREARKIVWHSPFTEVATQVEETPRQRWFSGGSTNLCFNAVDRHLAKKGAQTAIIELDARGVERRLSYQALHDEVAAMSEIMRQLGVRAGMRVLIYLPMIAEAHIAMLACARIGAIHVVVFAGLPAPALAERINASMPALIISANAGLEHGKYESYRGVLRQALALSQHQVAHLLMVERPVDVGPSQRLAQEIDYTQAREQVWKQPSPCVWLPSTATSHLLYTSGTSGQPKGILRDTAGYAVALLATLEHVYQMTCNDEVIFTTADVGWVVGHSYGVYAPLLAGMTTLVVEGGPLISERGDWWQVVARFGVTRLLTAPSAMRLLRQHGTGKLAENTSSLRGIYLAGEANDPLTAQWLNETFEIPVVEHYWQTESGWPILAGCNNQLRQVLDRQVEVQDPQTGHPCAIGEPGVIMVKQSLGPGAMQSLWNNDLGHDRQYWQRGQNGWRYLTQDWGVNDTNGRITVLGRADDVINVGGQRLSTCEIENVVLNDVRVLETAAVAMAHPILGQLPLLYVVTALPPSRLKAFRQELIQKIVASLGRSARPRRVHFVNTLPRTRSGKVVRRELAA